jgi:hypothetical protein
MKTTSDIPCPETLTDDALATVQGGGEEPTPFTPYYPGLPYVPFPIAPVGSGLTEADWRALNAPPPPVYTDPSDPRSLVFPE